MDEELRLLSDTAREMFASFGVTEPTKDSVRTLWKEVESAGMARVSVAEPVGEGSPLPYLAALLRAQGLVAASVPLLEAHTAGSLVHAMGHPGGAGISVVAFDASMSGQARSTRLAALYGPLAETLVRVVAVDGEAVVETYAATKLPWQATENLAGEPTGVIAVDRLPAPVTSERIPLAVARRIWWVEVVGRSVQMLGAGELALDKTLTYVGERSQFGRTLSKFQSIQHTVSIMASLVAASSASCSAAITSLEGTRATDRQLAFEVLACRSQADRMASFVARNAHQLHGALGFTKEHSLRLATTRLVSWRSTTPTELAVNDWLGQQVVAAGDPWTLIAGTG